MRSSTARGAAKKGAARRHRVRLLGVALLIGALLLPSLASANVLNHAARTSAAPIVSGDLSPLGSRGAVGATLGPQLFNSSVSMPSAAAPPLSATSNSALFETPPPKVPATTPTVLTFLTSSTSTTLTSNFTAPAGPWGAVVLNYTGQAVNGVFDSSYRTYIGGVEVLFGTTPEYGQWVVLQDVTRYSALMAGTSNITFLLGAAVTNGHFVSSLSLSFYPVPKGGVAPHVPKLVIPLWYRQIVQGSTPTISIRASVPVNATDVTMEIYAYGFGPDEFWYASQPNLRYVMVSLDGRHLSSVLPFPYLNTGGIDLFTWRPITGAFTLNDRPYEVNLTAALGLIEGTHYWNATVANVPSGADWLVGGVLFVDTGAAIGASLTSYSFPLINPQISTDGATYYDESAQWSYRYSSVVSGLSSSWNVSAVVNQSFVNDATMARSSTTSWQNLTADESTSAQVTSVSAGSTLLAQNLSTVSFPLAMDLGSQLVITSTTNGSYPKYGNFTSYLLGFHQEWSEADRSSTLVAGAWQQGSSSVDDRVSGGPNIYAGKEELISPTAALILNISFIISSTTKQYTEMESWGGSTWSYAHLLEGSAYQPPPPDQAETILVDEVTIPLIATLSVDHAVTDTGVAMTLRAAVSGGGGGYRYAWSGLPVGCNPSNASAIVCVAHTAGTYSVGVTVSDYSGLSAPVATVAVVVNAAPLVQIMLPHLGVDVGETLEVASVVSGGTAPLACLWFVNGTAAGAATNCTAPLDYNTSAVGSLGFMVQVRDGVGVRVNSTSVNASVASLPSVQLSTATGTTSLRVGTALTLAAAATGGLGPYTYVWWENGAVFEGANGTQFAFLGLAKGTVTVQVQVIDSTGAKASSAGINLTVTAVPSGATTSSSSPSSADIGAYVLLGLAVGALAVFLLHFTVLPPRTPPPPPPRRDR